MIFKKRLGIQIAGVQRFWDLTADKIVLFFCLSAYILALCFEEVNLLSCRLLLRLSKIVYKGLCIKSTSSLSQVFLFFHTKDKLLEMQSSVDVFCLLKYYHFNINWHEKEI